MLKLPTGWGARTETLSVQGSTDGTELQHDRRVGRVHLRPGRSNTVTINFGATSTRYVRLNITANTGWPAAQISELEVYGATHLVDATWPLGKTMAASGVIADLRRRPTPTTATRPPTGRAANNAFPQWIQVDLGAVGQRQQGGAEAADRLGRPHRRRWRCRAAPTGSSFTDIVASAGVHLRPGQRQHRDHQLHRATTTRYVRLNITANTGWPAGQLSEFEVYGPTTGDTQAPTAPTNLAFTQPQPARSG